VFRLFDTPPEYVYIYVCVYVYLLQSVVLSFCEEHMSRDKRALLCLFLIQKKRYLVFVVIGRVKSGVVVLMGLS
jgi:hypothetical protein